MTMLVNGIATSRVEAADRGFQYGDGVFTTIAVRQGIPVFLSRHLARLERDCRRLSIPFPDSETLTREARLLCTSQPEGVLKIQITRGLGGRGYRPPEPAVPTRVLGIHPPPDYPPELARDGVEVRLCRTRLGIGPGLAGIKHLNRLEQILAQMEWPLGEIREGLMLDSEGHVTEGTMTNLFLVRQGVLMTPRLDLCGVAGVMRGLVLEYAVEAGRRVEETRVGLDDLAAADEAFLTNSIIGVWPIRRIEQRIYPVGPVTQEIALWLAARIREEAAGACTG
jgi:4-amino-4-deoxychorismate lyase